MDEATRPNYLSHSPLPPHPNPSEQTTKSSALVPREGTLDLQVPNRTREHLRANSVEPGGFSKHQEMEPRKGPRSTPHGSRGGQAMVLPQLGVK